jgi:glycosyltransferase involved in cell wall biosynthesis
MKTVLPDIDVIIPFHRVNRDLISAIQSIEKCRGVNARLILVNDTQGASLLQTYEQVIETKEVFTNSQGYLSALAIGVEASDRPYIGFLDSDDLWKPNKLERQLDFMKENNLAFTFSIESKPIISSKSIVDSLTLRNWILLNDVAAAVDEQWASRPDPLRPPRLHARQCTEPDTNQSSCLCYLLRRSTQTL